MNGCVLGRVTGHETWTDKKSGEVVTSVGVVSGMSMLNVRSEHGLDFQEDELVFVFGQFKAYDRQVTVRDAFLVRPTEPQLKAFKAGLMGVTVENIGAAADKVKAA